MHLIITIGMSQFIILVVYIYKYNLRGGVGSVAEQKQRKKKEKKERKDTVAVCDTEEKMQLMLLISTFLPAEFHGHYTCMA